MAKFDVEVHRTLYVAFMVEADTKEKAEALSKERIETEYKDLNTWNEYVQELGFIVEPLPS
jgi:hypothetical protein